VRRFIIDTLVIIFIFIVIVIVIVVEAGYTPCT
jgi:hypothetical protein